MIRQSALLLVVMVAYSCAGDSSRYPSATPWVRGPIVTGTTVSTLARISGGWRLSQSPGMTSSPAFVASAATREPVVRRCPCGNSACSGGPNRVPGPMSGKCASVVWARQLLNVSLGPMAALPLVRSSRATQPARLSKTFHRPARMPPGVRTLAISGPRSPCRTSAWHFRRARHRRTRPAAVSPRPYPAGHGPPAGRGAVRPASPGRARPR